MIDQDRERFARIFTNMLITLSPREEHRVGVKAYFDALNHTDPLPIEVIEQAGRQIQSRAGQKWFPTSGEGSLGSTASKRRVTEDSPSVECWRLRGRTDLLLQGV
mgnify:CR=1 FL=1